MQMNIISTKPKRINKVLAFTLFLATLAYFFYWQQQIQKAERIKMYKESLFNQYRDVYDAYHYSKYNEFWNKLTSKDIQRYRQEWQDFVNTIPPRQPGVGKQGIVYTAHSNIARMAIVSIQMLRKNNCSLPVEVFHYGDELAETDVKALKSLPGVMVKDLIPLTQNSLKKGNDEKMFEAKGAALIHSEFDQLLFLDSDNVAVIDPTFLFSSQAFLETGAIFWKDFWKTRPDNPIYEILDIEFRDNYEQESGQVLLDKSRPEVWKALNLAFYMQRQKDLYFKLLNGDKDTFNYAWQALKVPFHMVTPHVAIAGVGTDRICGHTMVQFVPLPLSRDSIPDDRPWNQQVLFMHTNTLKYYADEVKFGPQAFQLFQHTPYLIAKDDYPTIFYSAEGRFCIEFAEYEHDGAKHKPVTVKFKNILPNFAETYQYMINKVHLDDYGL